MHDIFSEFISKEPTHELRSGERDYDTQIANNPNGLERSSTPHFQPGQCAGAAGELVGFDAHALEHADEQIA